MGTSLSNTELVPLKTVDDNMSIQEAADREAMGSLEITSQDLGINGQTEHSYPALCVSVNLLRLPWAEITVAPLTASELTS